MSQDWWKCNWKRSGWVYKLGGAGSENHQGGVNKRLQDYKITREQGRAQNMEFTGWIYSGILILSLPHLSVFKKGEMN